MICAVLVSVGCLLATQAHAADSRIPQRPPTLREASHDNSRVEQTVPAGKAVLVVGKIAPQQLTIYSPVPSSWKSYPQFPITLTAKSGDGPYANLRVRVEDPNQAKSTVITSNFTTDALSFWKDCPKCVPLDLWSSGTGSSQGSNQEGKKDDARTVGEGSQRTIWARVESLGAGEYSPILRFIADGASETAEESKLALTLQIRHHWLFPGFVILLGSLAGWLGSKYVIGHRIARTLKHDANALSETAAFLARPDPRVGGWRVPGESASYALVRVRTILHQVEHLAKSVFQVIAGEQEIRDRLAEAKRRLDALHTFRTRRLALHELALDRPAVQRKVGETLRRALDILDRPAFGEDQKSEFDALLKKLEDWTKPELRDTLYCNAVKEHITDLLTQVSPVGLAGDKGDQICKLLTQLKELNVDALSQQTAQKLLEYDRKTAALSLLWRDRNQDWAQALAEQQKNNASLEALYKTRDEEIWKCIKAHKLQLEGATEAQSYDLVEVRLELVKSDAFSDSYLVRHPCRIHWEVTPPGDEPPRQVVTDGLTFAQYFQYLRNQGTYGVSAYIEWHGDRTEKIKGEGITVQENPEYLKCAAFDWWIESAVTSLAALFAVLTGLQSQYGPTFGSFGQYIGLFLWAAGASTGGNLFKQLGTGRTAGGQEGTLPGK